MLDPQTQHAVSAGALAAPLVSYSASLPGNVTIAVGILGAIWYAIQIGDWIYKRLQVLQQLKDSSRRVAADVKGSNHGPDLAD